MQSRRIAVRALSSRARPAKRQADGSGMHHTARSAAPQVRDAPKDPVFAPHQVSPDMVQSRRLAARKPTPLRIGVVYRIERGAHFDVIQQRRAAMGLPFAIDGRA